MKPRLLDLKQFSVAVGVSYSTMRRWKRNGLLPTPRIKNANHRCYWTSDQVHRWWRSLSLIDDHEGTEDAK